MNCDDVGKAWYAFHGLFAGVIDKVAPVKKVRLKQRSEPCITHEILGLIKERDEVLLDFKRSNQKSFYEQFCKIRKLIQNKVKKAKKYFSNDKVEECKGAFSQLWKTLKSTGLSKGTPGSSKVSLSEGEGIIFKNLKVANILNKFFTSVEEKLVNKLPKRPIHFAKQFLKDYYQEKGVENYFHFSTVGEEEIENLLNGLTTSKATGLDSLSARFFERWCRGHCLSIGSYHKFIFKLLVEFRRT